MTTALYRRGHFKIQTHWSNATAASRFDVLTPRTSPVDRPAGELLALGINRPLPLFSETHYRFRCSEQRVPPRNGFRTFENGNGGTGLQSVDMDELPQLNFVAENEVVLVKGKGDVYGVGGIGDLYVESMLGPQVLLVEVSRNDVSDLQQSRSVLARGPRPRVHGIEEFLEDAGC